MASIAPASAATIAPAPGARAPQQGRAVALSAPTSPKQKSPSRATHLIEAHPSDPKGLLSRAPKAPGGQPELNAPSNSGHVWSRRFGDKRTQNTFSIAADSAGNVLVTGVVAGTVDFGAGPTQGLGDNAFVAKLDPKGKLLWAKRFDSPDSFGVAVAVDGDDNVLFTGGYRTPIDLGGGPLASAFDALQLTFVAKLDADGDHVWSRGSEGDQLQFPQRIAADSAGNVIVTGFFESFIDFGAGPLAAAGGMFDDDVFVAKFGPTGALLWDERFGGTDLDRGLGLAIDSNDDLLLTGVFLSAAIDFGGGPLAQAGSGDIFVARLDPSGDHLWSRRFGDGASQDAHGIAIDPAGDVVVGASIDGSVDFGGGLLTSAGTNDVAVVKLDAAGNHVWSERFGGPERQDLADLAVDAQGNIVLTGFTTEAIDFGGGPIGYAGDNDVFLAKLDPEGDLVRASGFGDGGLQTSTSVTTDPSGHILLTGYFDGAIHFGGTKLKSAGDLDIFVAKFAP